MSRFFPSPNDITNWRPAGQTDITPVLHTTVDEIEALAASGKSYYLSIMFEDYKRNNEPDFNITEAFVKGALYWTRRHPDIMQNFCLSLVEYSHLTDASFTMLAAALGDLSDLTCARTLFERARGRKFPIAFYMHLMRAACETAAEVDMVLSTQVADEMTAQGHKYTCGAMRILIHGYSRLPGPPIQPILRMAAFHHRRPTAKHESCVTNEIVAALERLVGEDARSAVQFVRQLEPAFIFNTVRAVVPAAYEPRESHDPSKPLSYYVIDISSVDIPEYKELCLPSNSYAVFLFSLLRILSDKGACCGHQHVTTTKINRLRGLFQHKPHECIVFPLDQELLLHSSSTQRIDDSGNCRLVAYLDAIEPGIKYSNISLIVVTNSKIIKSHVESKLPTFKILTRMPTVGTS